MCFVFTFSALSVESTALQLKDPPRAKGGKGIDDMPAAWQAESRGVVGSEMNR